MKRETAFRRLLDNVSIPVDQGVVYAETVKTHYLVAGCGRPVILLHGAGAGGIAWTPVFEPLASGLLIIAPDIVGYGESDKPKAMYDRPFYARWLRGFLDALNVDRASLIGHSQGGAIALQFALEDADRVDRLVLVDSSGLGRTLCLGALIGVLWMNAWPSQAASRWASRYVLHAPSEVDECLITYRLAVARMAGGRRVFWRGGGRANAPVSPRQLRRIRHPTLIIWGEEDRFFPAEHARSACRIMPNAQVHIIPDAGHCPFLEQPEEFSETVARFINCDATYRGG